MSAKTAKLDNWYVGTRGRLAHRLWVDWRFYVRAHCGASHDAVKRPATPEDRRCKRCEERSRG